MQFQGNFKLRQSMDSFMLLPKPVEKSLITHDEMSRADTLSAGNAYIHMNVEATSTQFKADGTMCHTRNPNLRTFEGEDGTEQMRTTKFVAFKL